MHVRWHGQSAFLLKGEKRAFIDPFGNDFRYRRSKAPRRMSFS